MTVRHTAAAILLSLASSCVAQHIVAIEHARIFDGTGTPAHSATVVITGDRITALGADVKVPKGAEVIDAKGKTLLPGFFDVHTHLNASAGPLSADWQKSTAAYLICGVTTIDEFSANREMYAPLRKLMAEGTVAAPHINFATRISTPGGHGAESGMGEFTTVEVSTPVAAHEAMKQVLAYKPDVIKIFTDGWRYGKIPNLSSMNVQTVRAIVEDAHRAGIKVLTHTLTVEGAKVAAGGGVDIIAHSIQDAPIDQELLNIMKTNGTSYAPTMAVYEANKPAPTTPLMLSVLEHEQGIEVTRAVAAKQPMGLDDPAMKRWNQLQENLRTLYSAGIPVALGTDNGMPSTPHGWGSLREMELMVGAGLTPSQALQAGTRVSATALGVSKERGTIEVGKLADLVLIDGRPDETIADVEKTDIVWLAGKPIDRAKLIAAIAVPGQMPLPVSVPAPLVDDMEKSDGKTDLGTEKYPSTDAGADHSHILLQQVIRPEGGHAWMATVKFGPEKKNYARLNVPLTPGEITLADISKYKGISIEVKGQGTYRIVLNTYDVRDRKYPAAAMEVTPEWKTIQLPFSTFSAGSNGLVDLKEVRALILEAYGNAGDSAWMEVDNIKLY
jgi:imidazolonepropionase-like amidohydrolase